MPKNWTLPYKWQRKHNLFNVSLLFFFFFSFLSHKAIVICTVGVDCPISVTYIILAQTLTHCGLWGALYMSRSSTLSALPKCCLDCHFACFSFFSSCRHYMHKNIVACSLLEHQSCFVFLYCWEIGINRSMGERIQSSFSLDCPIGAHANYILRI